MIKKSFWSEIFGLDLRALAFFRIGLGLVILIDLLNRATYLSSFYSDEGVLGRAFYFDKTDRIFDYSLYFINGTSFFNGLLFFLAALFAIGLIIGFKTRLMTFLSWLFLISLHTRNPGVLQGGDNELRLLLFWAIFLPLGGRYSIDTLFSRSQLPKQISSVASFCYLIQIFLVYFCAALLKESPEWRSEGTAIYYAMNLDIFTTQIGKWMLGLGDLLKPLSIGVWYLELLGAFLFFIPGLQKYLRPLGILLFVGLHLSFVFTIRLGIFPWVSILAFIPLIPSWIFDRFPRPVPASLDIFYDPDCGFCRKAARLVSGILGYRSSQLHPADQDQKVFEAMRQKNSWVVRTPNSELHFSYGAFIQLLSFSFWGKKLLFLFSATWVRKIGEKLYLHISTHRPQWSWTTQAISEKNIELRSSYVTKTFLLLSLTSVILWNYGSVRIDYKVPDISRKWAMIFHLDQEWNMFAPKPTLEDGWFVAPARTASGDNFDFLRWEFENEMKLTDLSRPEHVSQSIPDQRWRKYLMNLTERNGRIYSEGLAQYFCRRWDSRHPHKDRLELVELHFMEEKTPPPGIEPEVKQKKLWRYHCYDKVEPPVKTMDE